jgi:hypothetical protein
LPTSKTEGNDAGRQRFNDFRSELQKKNCRLWSDRGELIAAVFTGVQHLKKTRPGVGWSKATEAADDALKDELLSVRREMDSLNAELEQARRRNPPAGAERLAQGPDQTSIVVNLSEGQTLTCAVTWEEVIRSVLPQTLGAGVDEQIIASTLISLARENVDPFDANPAPVFWQDPIVPRTSFGTVMNQMVALGLIEGAPDPRNPAKTLWRATPYGVREGCRLVAVRREESRGARLT